MKKKNILNLIRYHVENNDNGFRNEAIEIAKDFDKNEDAEIAKYIMSLLSDTDGIVPQLSFNDKEYSFLNKIKIEYHPLPMPSLINEDIKGVINALKLKAGINKLLFYGNPGTGKTETAKQLARMFERELLIVNFEELIDSKLGQTSKNILSLFDEINSLERPYNYVILFDEIDSIALNRVDSHDLREMGRATSTILKGLDRIKDDVIIIATTNLYHDLDKALVRRFDYAINFDRYSEQDLVEVGTFIYDEFVNRFNIKGNKNLFEKILKSIESIPSPGSLRNIIKTSLAFSDFKDKSSHIKLLYKKLNNINDIDINTLLDKNFTTREIQTLTGISKSKVARDKKKIKNE